MLKTHFTFWIISTAKVHKLLNTERQENGKNNRNGDYGRGKTDLYEKKCQKVHQNAFFAGNMIQDLRFSE